MWLQQDFNGAMTSSDKQVFTAERRRVTREGTSGTIDEVVSRISSLEKSLSAEFENQFRKLCEKLDVIVEDDNRTSAEDIMAEIQAMNEHISVTKQEVAALKPVDDANTTISFATEELAEVVQSTEIAANTILENTEQLDQIVVELRGKIAEGDPDGIIPDIEKIEFINMELLTACSFQDVTGQRITKVVNSLNFIEQRLNKMIEIWKIEHGTADTQKMGLPMDDKREDRDMLHGPQNAGMNQNDIDALFD
jgi:chemotaxis regulatin CheY-phosphate phosphatase CheZ